MAEEALTLLAVRPEGVYVDATAGLGGHMALIAQRLTTGVVIANDRDAESLELARANTAQWAERIRYHQGTFSQLRCDHRGRGVSESGWAAGGPGRKPLPVGPKRHTGVFRF